ncbi:MAG: aldehyde ferredoxin oxidoreductase C-terminal domain-containing protein, partial [Planctomycetota bacterium]
PWDPEAFYRLSRGLRSALQRDAGLARVIRFGPLLPLLDRGERPAWASFRNFQKRLTLPSPRRLSEEGTNPALACTGCPTACNRFLLRRGGTPRMPRFGGLSPEALLSLGPRLGILRWDHVLDLVGFCFFAGLDPGALGAMGAWLAECRSEGILTAREAGEGIRFADATQVAVLIRAIAGREGPGRYLGDGAVRAASRFGSDAESRLVHWRGVIWPSVDPRLTPGAAMAFFASPLDPDPFLTTNLADRGDLARHYLEPLSDLGDYTRRRLELKALADALGVCSLPLAALPIWKAKDLLALTHALTGADPATFSGIGKRILALEEMLHEARMPLKKVALSPRFRERGVGWEGVDLDPWEEEAKRVLGEALAR